MMMSMSLIFAVSEEMSEVFRLFTEVSPFLSKDFQKLSKVFSLLSEPQIGMSKPHFILPQKHKNIGDFSALRSMSRPQKSRPHHHLM